MIAILFLDAHSELLQEGQVDSAQPETSQVNDDNHQ